MATISEMLESVNELIVLNAMTAIPFPDDDVLIENYVDKKHKTSLERILDPEEREKMRQTLIEYFKNGGGKDQITKLKLEFKLMFAKLKEQIDEIKKAIQNTTASNAVPSVITTGAATSAPNPAYTMIENAQKKAALTAMISTASMIAATMLLSAADLQFEVPDEVMLLIDSLKALVILVKAIPG